VGGGATRRFYPRVEKPVGDKMAKEGGASRQGNVGWEAGVPSAFSLQRR